MKFILLLLLFTTSSFSFAQQISSKYTIVIHSIDVLTFEEYSFTIVKNENNVCFKYSLLDSVQYLRLKQDTADKRIDRELNKTYKDTDSKKRDILFNELNKIVEKYYVYDNDSLTFNAKAYTGYCKLLDSVYSGGDFKDKKSMMLDGISYSIEVRSETVNHDYETISPDDNTNPILYHLIRDTFIIYRKLSKNPLVYHKHFHQKYK